jgi:N-acetylneuraminate synthase
MLRELRRYSDKEGILFMSTAFSVGGAREVNKYVQIHKVASYELNHIKLLKYLASTKKPVILSTGASNYEEIDFAVSILKKYGAKSIALLHCTACYPAPLKSLNLSAIPEIKKRFNIPVGFSDHSLDPLIGPLSAVALGATIVEKHFTLDKTLEGPDHMFALEPNELRDMIQAIRNAEKTRGDGIKKILEEEKELRRFAVRSVHATRNIMKGETFRDGENIDLLRPGNRKRGADARHFNSIDGKRAARKISAGEGISLKDCLR